MSNHRAQVVAFRFVITVGCVSSTLFCAFDVFIHISFIVIMNATSTSACLLFILFFFVSSFFRPGLLQCFANADTPFLLVVSKLVVVFCATDAQRNFDLEFGRILPKQCYLSNSGNVSDPFAQWINFVVGR